MNENLALATKLEKRLPELLWKLRTLDGEIPLHRLPKGLFKGIDRGHPQSFIEDVRHDLGQLRKVKSRYCASYLAAQIQQKISVLVRLCKEGVYKQGNSTSQFDIDRIVSRKGLLEKIETEIQALSIQDKALSQRLLQLKKVKDNEGVLILQKELGALRKRQTLLKERIQKEFY